MLNKLTNTVQKHTEKRKNIDYNPAWHLNPNEALQFIGFFALFAATTFVALAPSFLVMGAGLAAVMVIGNKLYDSLQCLHKKMNIHFVCDWMLYSSAIMAVTMVTAQLFSKTSTLIALTITAVCCFYHLGKRINTQHSNKNLEAQTL